MYFLKLAQETKSSKTIAETFTTIKDEEGATKLKPHQKRVLDKLKNNSVLVYHGLGSGKTLLALRAAQQMGGGSVIGPASLKDNFQKERKKHKTKTKVDYTTYAKPGPKSEKLLIYDEIHRIGRMDSQRSKYPDDLTAERILGLTGTPIRNEPSELIPLMRAIGVDIPRDKKKFYEHFVEKKKVKPGLIGRLKGIKPGTVQQGKNLELLEKALEGKVDYYMPKKKGYPNVQEEEVNVEMSPVQYETYAMGLKQNPTLAYKVKYGLPPNKEESSQMNAFLNAVRQISNTPEKYNLSATSEDSTKIRKIIDDIVVNYEKDKNYKGVTYSNYLGSGVEAIEKILKEREIPYAKFTGGMTKDQRNQIIKDYNEGKVKHLLISGAGSEGLDLKGTKLMQITEPHWNNARIEQVKGRAVRFKSHDHLPKKERLVKVKNYYSVIPKNKFKEFFVGKQKSSDQYLKYLSDTKSKLNKDFLRMLEYASDPNKSLKD